MEIFEHGGRNRPFEQKAFFYIWFVFLQRFACNYWNCSSSLDQSLVSLCSGPSIKTKFLPCCLMVCVCNTEVTGVQFLFWTQAMPFAYFPILCDV